MGEKVLERGQEKRAEASGRLVDILQEVFFEELGEVALR